MAGPVTEQKDPRPAQAALALAAFVFLSLLLGSLTAVVLMRFAPPDGFLAEKGGDTLMRRASMAWALILLPFLLKKSGWRGWKDIGWFGPESSTFSRTALRDYAGGVLLGVVTMGAVVGWVLMMKARSVAAPELREHLGSNLFSFALSALFVGVIEETFARGILFRSFARCWKAWAAALVTSLLFAAAHFVHPAPDAFGGSIASSALQVFGSALAGIPEAGHFGMRFLNLTLLGLVLCAFVHRTGTIWLAAGAHAGWVWVIKANGFLADINYNRAWTLFLGQRGDSTDSLLATVMLTTLLAAVLLGGRLDRKRALRATLLLLALAVIGGSVLAWTQYFRYRIIPKRWGMVEPGLVYRSGQLSASLVKRTLEQNGIRVIIDLTSLEPGDRDQAAEQRVIQELGIEAFRFPLIGDGTGDIHHYADAIETLMKAKAASKPVLVHCAAGSQRTGAAIVFYRVLVERKIPSAAVTELETYDGNVKKNSVLIRYINANMGELARLLADRGVIDQVPDPLPVIEP